MPRRALILAGALVLAGCIVHVRTTCPSCPVVDRDHTQPPRFRPGTRTVFVLVPGILGYGWEWSDPVAALRATPGVDFVVFWWDPTHSVGRAADDLAEVVGRLLREGPAREVRIIAHSAGGMVGAQALAGIDVPEGRKLKLITVGAPLAGMKGAPSTCDDPMRTPLTIAMIGTFTRYPDPPPRSEVVEYVTQYPGDPVMEPRYGHDPADPRVGPRGATRIALPHDADHNHILTQIIAAELQEIRRSPAPVATPPAPSAAPPRSAETATDTAPDGGQ